MLKLTRFYIQKILFSSMRQLGKVLKLSANTLTKGQALSNHAEDILHSLHSCGLVCIKNVDFNPEQLVFASQAIFSKENILKLPPSIGLDNLDPKYDQVTWLGNVNHDGAQKQVFEDINAWHTDGDFWPQSKRLVFDCVNAKKIPKNSETQFLDLVGGYLHFEQEEPEIMSQLKNLLGVCDIDKITSLHKLKKEQVIQIQGGGPTKHPIANKNLMDMETGCLYLSYHRAFEIDTNKQVVGGCQDASNKLCAYNLIQKLVKNYGYYSHKWEQGDFLIWDNSQLLRKSVCTQGKRSLIRTQSRMTPGFIKRRRQAIA